MFQPKRCFKNLDTQNIDRHTHKISLLVSSLMMVSLFLSGCLTTGQSVVKTGDEADVHFTCKFKSGDVAISTYQELPASVNKSVIFLPRDRNTPLKLPAGFTPQELKDPNERGFEGEIARQVATAIVGFPVGKTEFLELKSDLRPETQKGEWMGKIARVRVRSKEIRLTPGEYEAKAGGKPEIGQEFVLDPLFPGKVESVSESEVIIRFYNKSGSDIDTPFGKGTIKELQDRFEIVIDAHIGSLVRTGGLIGRIVNVDERQITIDYSHPFGGEVLLCDVLVESVTPTSAQVAPQGGDAVSQESKIEKPVTSPDQKQAGTIQTKWIEDYNEGLALAKKEGKPAAMVLYADWCGWCKKLINESFQSPVVMEVEEKLVLIKVNSDKQKDLYTQYQQRGYPLLVLFDREGKVAQRIDGYVDAAKLRKALDELLKG